MKRIICGIVLCACGIIWGQKESPSAQADDPKQELQDIQKSVKQVKSKLESEDQDVSVEKASKRVSDISENFAALEEEVQDTEKNGMKEELKNTREEIGSLRKEIERTKEEQEAWYTQARVTTADPVYFIRDISDFNAALDENELVVAYFYELPEDKKKIITKDGVRRRTDRWYTVDQNGVALASVAKDERMRRAGVHLIAVNLSRDRLNRLKQRYDIQSKDAVLLFENGAVYTDNRVTGDFDAYTLRRFVKRYFGDLIDERIEELEKREQKQRKKVRYVYDRDDRPRFGFGVGYGYPYYRRGYYGYPYYGRHYYGSPYYGRYGSGFGFSIGI